MKDYIKEQYYYSLMYGRGVYVADSAAINDPFYNTFNAEGVTQILYNFYNEQFFIRRVTCNSETLERYKNYIKHPPKGANILWPVDIISLDDYDKKTCTVFLEHEYSENVSDPNSRKGGDHALVFPYRDGESLRDWTHTFKGAEESGWKDERIRNAAKSLLEEIAELNASGYIYGDIHVSRFFYDNKVCLDFSDLICSVEDTVSSENRNLCKMKTGGYPVEFAEPALVRGKKQYLDYNMQNYSISALLFYLFVGRYPYEGPMVSAFVDDGLSRHYTKFTKYHETPVFIFDPEDNRNCLGLADYDQHIINLWKDLPQTIRDTFIYVFQEKHAASGVEEPNPSPEFWLKQLESLSM